jgi:hypothetical protein
MVSAVSPDWDKTISSVWPSISGLRYLSSLASRFDGYAAKLLQGVPARAAGVIGRAAGGNDDLAYALKIVVGQALEHNPAFLYSRLYGGFKGAGLLHDFLEHEVLVAALFGRLNIPNYARNGFFYLISRAVVYRDFIGRELGELAVLKIDYVFRI